MKKNEEQVSALQIVGLNYGGIEDPQTYVLILKEIYGDRFINMTIGKNDADFLTIILDRIPYPTLLIYDILNEVLSDNKIEIQSAIINAYSDENLFAEITLSNQKKYSCRPTDAIILALKNGIDILIDESVLKLISFTEKDLKETVQQQNSPTKKTIAKKKLDETDLSRLISDKDIEGARVAKFTIINEYEKEQTEAVNTENYEKAKMIRDKINDLKKIII